MLENKKYHMFEAEIYIIINVFIYKLHLLNEWILRNALL